MHSTIRKIISLGFICFFITSCGGGGGSEAAIAPKPSVNLSADPTSVLLENDSTLTWSSLNTTSCSATWTSKTSTSGSELVTIATPGNNAFSISCSGDGGTGQSSVTVEGYRNTSGVVVDGYISGAEVCIDEDDSWTCDIDENSTVSDNNGNFTIKYAGGNLVSIGGIDLDSQTFLDNLLITHKLTDYSDFKAITPVTSVAAFMEDSSLVNAALGIDPSIDVFTFDPVANKGDGGINDYLYEKGNQLTVLAFAFQNIINNLNATTETTQDYFQAITEEIEKEYSETNAKVDIEAESFISQALDNVIAAKSASIDENTKANTAKALASVLPVIQVNSSDYLTTSVIRFAVSTLQTDIQGIANGTASEEIIKSYTEDVLAHIAEDQNISANEITPNIFAIADAASTQEDTVVTIYVLLNDSYLNSAPISLTVSDGFNGTTAVTETFPKQISYSPDPDFNGTDTFSYTITQGDKIASADVTVTIEAVNDVPSINIASFRAAENQTAIGTVAATDAEGDAVTFTVSGTELAITSSGVLTFASAPDYETKTSYTATVTASDGTNSSTQDITVSVTNVNDVAPGFSSSASFSASENQTAIGTVAATDAEGDAVTFTVSGTELAITSAGVLTFASAPDYETKTSYTATVTASDGTNSSTQDITVSVTNVNDVAPGFSSSASFSASENQTAIGTVAATDAEGDAVTFTVSGTELAITSSGVLTFASAPDYETKTSYTATVTASDGTNSSTQDITVSVTNVSDVAPGFSSSASFSASENQTAIGTVAATDAEGDAVTFTVSGTELAITSAGVLTFASAPDYETKTSYTATVTASDGTNSSTQDITVSVTNVNDVAPGFSSSASFSASENQTAIGTVAATDAEGDAVTFTVSGTELAITSSGVLTFASAPDYETKTSYTATVTASDGTNSSTQDITVSVTNVNDVAPGFSSSASFSASENQTAIGTVAATDAEGDAVTFTVSGTELAITSAGVLTFASAPDYETKTSYTATVTASDGTNSSTQDITVSVTNVNDVAPGFSSSASFSASENQTAIGTVAATDAEGDAVTFTVSGTELAITSSGVLTFASAPDYETKTSYTATVTASDGTNSSTQDITVSVTNVNDVAPGFSSSASFSASENQTAIGTVAATDAEGDAVTFTVSGTELAITSAGVLTFASAPDYETKTSYTATVTASDGTNSSTQDITVSVTNVNEAPIFTSSASFSASENQTAIGTVAATDAEGDAVTFTVSGTELAITSAGVLTFASAPDYETKTSYTATVTASDGTNSSTQDITVSVTNVSDVAPGFSSSASFSASENQTAIGTVAATDAEGDAVTFTVSGNELAITSSGVLTFASAPDYETKTSYTATVTASDGTNSSTQDITVSVTNVNEAPIFTSSASFSAAENQTAIGSVSVVDSEDGTLTYSLSGTDASSLAISSSGVITFGSAPNYESKNSYSATIVASDGTNITTQAITVSVIDVNDVPVATAASYYMNLKPQSQTSVSITLAGTDEDGNTLAYSIVSNGIHGTASLSGTTVTYQTSASTQSAQSESFTFKVNDGTVDSSAATISIDLRTDPLYKYQWHLNNTGQTNFATNAGTSGVDLNVDTAISSGYTGNGVTVAVLDTGLEIAHEDLVDNIISGSYDFLNSDTDPTNPANDGDHGTSVAGLIAAKGWNNKGGRGVAPNASLIGYNYLKNQSLSNQLKAWGSNPPVSVDVDIYNMSYGTGYGVDENDDPNTTYNLPSYLSSSYIAGLTNGLSLRNNKGAIYIKSSGNDYGTSATSDCGSDLTCTDMMIDNYSAMPYIIHVGALQANEDVSSYTTPGSALWISGFGGQNGGNESIVNGQGYSFPSGIYKPAMMTVDQSGCTNGYAGSNGETPYYNEFQNPSGHSENSSCNYTSTFNGTSSAAPIVAGVVALMLEANPALTWRDVKHIIATTADQVGSDSDYTYILRGIKQYEWETNSAGYKFHNRFGFGKIDAAEAVTTAASYTANSRGTFSTAYVSSKPINLSINDNGTNTTSSLSITKPSGSNNFVEFIQLAVQFSHDVPKSIGIRLLSPDGTIINVMTPMTNIGTNPSSTIFEIGVAGLYGESIEGTWTLAVNDYIDDGTAGALTYWDIKVYGN